MRRHRARVHTCREESHTLENDSSLGLVADRRERDTRGRNTRRVSVNEPFTCYALIYPTSVSNVAHDDQSSELSFCFVCALGGSLNCRVRSRKAT